MSLTYFLRDNGACGYYRLDLPLQMIKKKTDFVIKKVEKGDNSAYIETCLDTDIMVIPRPHEMELLAFIEKIKAMGKKVVIDIDDNMFCISPLSPHYKDFGLENVQIEVNKQLVPLWTDGKNINLKENRERIRALALSLQAADLVTVTTDILADVYREYNPNVAIVPNCVDTNLWQKLPLKKEENIKLYWAGGSSHYEDWLLLKDVIPVIMNKYPQTKLVLMGTKFDGTLRDIPTDRIEFHNWVPTSAYPYKSAILNPDISLIPLSNTEFNSCKSAIKWIEQGSLAVPSVCSLVSPYKEVYDGTNGVFVENNSVSGWIDGISMIIEDPILRATLGGAAKNTVMQKFDINTQYTQWIETYQELLNGN